MNKIIIDKYIIATDVYDITELLSFLKENNIRAYNYKVRFIGGKIFLRAIVSENVILSIENLTLDKARNLFKEIEEKRESKYLLEFHNTPPSDIEFFNKLSFLEGEFHIFPQHILCKVENYRCKVKDRNILKILSEIFPTIRELTRPFNMNYLISKDRNELLCEVLSKYRGIRNPNLFFC